MTEAKISKLQQVADTFGCTVEQARNQYLRNIEGLEFMYRKALAGEKVNHYTAEELKESIDRFKAIANEKI